jgi:hypothetical protein
MVAIAQPAPVSAVDAVEGSSTGIATCHSRLLFRHRDFRFWHLAEVPPASRDFRFRGHNGHGIANADGIGQLMDVVLYYRIN